MTEKGFPEIDGYRILRVIGHGGMSTVYLAEQRSLERKVALKVMLAEVLTDEVSRARFENEARIIARLEHPNIVGIYEVGRTRDGLPFYAMPYLSHGHLGQRRLAGDQPKVASILRSLLQALDYAHVRGVVHRDVKAENVLFDDSDRPLLADFGIALRRGSNPRLTTAGLAVGSTAYMPPEQARGQDVDRRADIYSIGVLTWEMLVGRLPYAAGDALTMALKHVQEPVPRLPSPLRHWQGFIDRAMAKQPGDRFASAHEMLAALEELERRAGKAFGVVELPPEVAHTADSAPARARWRLPVLAGAAAAGLAALGYAAYLRYAPPPAPAPAAASATPVQAPPASATPAAAPAAAAPAATATAPTEDAQALGLRAVLANAEQQLRAGQLLAPANANAWSSLEGAWLISPTDPETLRLTALLFDALSLNAERALRQGDVATARLAYQRAVTLDKRRGGTGEAVAKLQQRMGAALDDRITLLLAKPATRGEASRLYAAATPWLQLEPARARSLQTRLRALAGNDRNAEDERNTAAAAAPAQETTGETELITVSRADYARFARATGREAAECGRGFLGRKLRWDNLLGGERRPVACVSAADALAYAAWLGSQDGHRYRLPSAGELQGQPTTPASWVSLCADHACSQRMVSGKPQPLDASRGYDDVGIRLVRSR
ncbi:serine/threonine-protein kinase [Thermomonas alba]|uniref:serine/threonine-protein kinase n=1 Tax=Thermomonas alba TaxID=2888525 RepID=UPI001F04645F